MLSIPARPRGVHNRDWFEPSPQIALARRLSASRDSTAQFGALGQLRLVPAVAPHEQSNGGRYLAIEIQRPPASGLLRARGRTPSSLAGVVLERDSETDAIARDRPVL